MSTPVIVSRMQNRRGTQAQFEALYPTYPGSGPNILQPGELALCTDSEKMYIGNIGGTFIELGASGGGTPGFMTPIMISLPPTSTPVVIHELDHAATPFLLISYSLADADVNTPNAVGTDFSKIGQLSITVSSTSATLTDEGTEINASTATATPRDITFFANRNSSGTVEISYTSTFLQNISFSTSTLVWITLLK